MNIYIPWAKEPFIDLGGDLQYLTTELEELFLLLLYALTDCLVMYRIPIDAFLTFVLTFATWPK